jgi:predicted negative regulator of RcsB-dependent stress response
MYATQFSSFDFVKKFSKLFSFKKKSTIIILIALVIIILVFIFSSYWIKSKKNKEQFQQEYSTLIKKIDENLLKAESSVIHKAERRASIYITQTEKLLEQLPKYSEIQDNSKSVQYYEEKITEINDKIKHIKKITDPNIYVQLPQELINADIKGLDFKEGTLYVYSESNPYMAMINTENNEITLLDSDTEIKTKDITIFKKYSNSPIITTFDKKTYLLNNDSNTLSEVNVPFENIDSKDIKTYSSNLYALDPQSSQIYKYTRLSNTNFGSGKKWLTNNTVDLSSAVDMYIDGSIYILLKNGKLYNYLNGTKQAFSLQNNIQPTIEFTTKLKYSESKKQFYILEPENNRVLVYGEKGDFRYQYMSDKFDDLKDIAFNDKTNTLIILNNSTLYSVTE